MGVFTSIYAIVRKIPRGSVATYGQIARLAGNPRMARQVGWALHSNPEPGAIPCHRVLNRNGELCKGFAFGGQEAQRLMLDAEGVAFLPDGRVDLERFGWQPAPDPTE
ncbi:MAG: MGMT family protein [Oscillospiraceae bacterium]|jgi:methylated-DNA-protein-cysteine methyltransferase-like protein|nr:MGMT family protein [Oscillospiraceae bacterium]